jgi:phosphatidate phosphatase APP1
VRELYNSLVAGKNPIFYLSSSPWNLYDFLTDFLDTNQLPGGPLLLTDLGVKDKRFFPSHREHKISFLRELLTTYSYPVVLIGDTGQKDPEIYLEIAQQFPGRVKVIYLRDASRDDRDMAVKTMVTKSSTPIIFSGESSVFLADALKRKLIADPKQ